MSKVTVYIPALNYGKYIRQAINSVLGQKYHDWELIVIDDGSTDNTRQVLLQYRDNPKVRIIHQESKGLSVSNNIALRLSSGSYIMRLDADDYLDENALLVLSNILDQRPEVGLVYPDYYRISQNGEIIDIQRRKKIGRDDLLLDLPAHGACTMIRKSCLRDLGGYNEDLPCQDGYELWLRFIEKYKPYNVNVPLFYYRQHPLSLTTDKDKLMAARHRAKRNIAAKRYALNFPKVLAIVPVLKQPPGSHESALKDIAGRPLIFYTLNEALKTRLLDRIAVVTNDEEVLRYIKKFPRVLGIKRPSELSLPNSRIEPTVHYVLRNLKKKKSYQPDVVMLLYVHTPLRRQLHIEKAIDTMLIFNTDSVVSVCEDNYFYYRHGRLGLTPLFKKRSLRLERDNLYRENAAIYLSRRSALTVNSFIGEKVGHITMLPHESVKIDSAFNLWLCERILRQWKK